jgi:hypothetical protein
MKLPTEPTEAQFTRMVVGLAKLHGWLVHHSRAVRVQRKDGRTYHATPLQGDPGLPDLILVHPERGELIVAELKVKANTATDEQAKWLTAFRNTGCASGVWRPESWPDIVRTLAGDA